MENYHYDEDRAKLISFNLDQVQYKDKPTSDEVKRIRTRLCSPESIVAVKDTVLIQAIENGQTFTPAVMTGTKSETWQSQQIIIADIDNDGDNYLFPNQAKEICKEYGVDPIMYYSFSNSKDRPKYRIMVILSEPIKDAHEARDITERFTDIFNARCNNCADTKISDNARLIFGSRSGSVFVWGKATPLEVMRNLPQKRAYNASHGDSITELAQSVADTVQRTTDSHSTSRGQFDLLEPLQVIPPEDYDEWIKCGMALKQEGYTVFDWDTWSRSSSKYEAGICEEKWRTFGTDKTVNGGYIVNLAKKYGYIPPRERVRTATSGIEEKAVQNATSEPVPPPTDKDAPPIKSAGATPEPPQPEPTPEQCFDEFFNEIQSERFKPISTGIDQLDKALQGGFERRTLVTLAAAPGTGKTAICQYILENMAYNGHTVVYVNLEMDRSQLLSRSISRISHHLKQNHTLSDDVNALQVKRGYQWTETQKQVIQYSSKYYRDYIAPNFRYVTTNPENIGSIDNTLSDILGKLEKITAELQQQGRPAPLVCVDYLQFIDYDLFEDGQRKPENADAIKQTLKEFKQFAMKHDTVCIMIMANNRASNQDGRASMDSGRDTSNIEYSGDVMMSLVFTAIEEKWKYDTGATDKNGNSKPALIDNDFINEKIDYTIQSKGEYPLIAKLLTLKVVKGRSIMSRGSAKFIYNGQYFHFAEDNGTPNPYWIT